ncbi:MAG TPA: alpha-amylase family glycosyl hydrolase [Elusimicrobiales bacterium]|nr:alpha-amylase family glycosyl hydrolase [Elusimicrobiales bacterium]
MLRANPHLIEINTRLWLNELRRKYASPDMTISTIPDEEWQALRHLGFDMIWLMGVWTPSPESARIARETPALREEAVSIAGSDENLDASPYSIYEYKLNPGLGFEWELKALREKLNAMGMKLLLDFVSNHVSRDNPCLRECLHCFVRGTADDYKARPDWFFELDTPDGKAYVAYARDPNFPAWTDSAQLNYFHPETREKMTRQLLEVAEMCDGVRCDMVMLTLNDIHEGTWGPLLERSGFRRPEREFWETAIKAVKESHREFVFLAEVYWGLEWRLQQLGFDYTYDKVVYDRLRSLGADEVRGHLRAEKLYQKRSVRFIDNHDEDPSVEAFGWPRAQAAAVVISTIKGLRFYSDSQLNGLRRRVPLQLKDLSPEPDLAVKKFYEKLLKIVDHPAFHGGEWALLEVRPCSKEDRSFSNILAWSWAQRRTLKIVAVNYSASPVCGILNVQVRASGETTALFEQLSDRFFSFASDSLRDGLRLENIPPYGVYIFDMEF